MGPQSAIDYEYSGFYIDFNASDSTKIVTNVSEKNYSLDISSKNVLNVIFR